MPFLNHSISGIQDHQFEQLLLFSEVPDLNYSTEASDLDSVLNVSF